MADDFDLWELISAPIAALNEAEAGAAARFVELLTDYAIEPPPPDGSGKIAPVGSSTALRQISFDMPRIAASGRMETRRITLPLLQLMPLGGVSIDQVTLSYGLKMQVSRGTVPSRITPASADAASTRARFVGRLAQTVGSPQPSSVAGDVNITIEIKLRQMDLPKGVLDLLQQSQGGIESLVPPDPGPLFSAELKDMSAEFITPGANFDFTVHIVARPNLPEPLHLSVTSQPSDALHFLTPLSVFDVTAERSIRLTVAVNPSVRRYGADTPVGISIVGRTNDRDGRPQELSITLNLPRGATGNSAA